jgi:hypothetical protein
VSLFSLLALGFETGPPELGTPTLKGHRRPPISVAAIKGQQSRPSGLIGQAIASQQIIGRLSRSTVDRLDSE